MRDEERDEIERACLRLVNRYCHLIDHGAASQVAELFSEDGIWVSAEMTLIGRAEIARNFARREENAGRMSRHVCSTSLLEIVEPDQARGVTYLTLYRHDGPADRKVSKIGGPALVGEYRDRFVRTQAGWRIQNRQVVAAFLFAEAGQ